MLAQVVYGEARGEIYDGQVAVAAVVLNRLEDDGFPDTLHGVVFQKNAFTCVNDGQYYLTPNRTAYQAALEAMQGGPYRRVSVLLESGDGNKPVDLDENDRDADR